LPRVYQRICYYCYRSKGEMVPAIGWFESGGDIYDVCEECFKHTQCFATVHLIEDEEEKVITICKADKAWR